MLVAPAIRNEGGAETPTYHFLVDLANTFKAFIGLNFIVVAYGFSKAGLVRGVIGLMIITFITEHCCLLLIQVKNFMYNQSIPSESSGAELEEAETDAESQTKIDSSSPTGSIDTNFNNNNSNTSHEISITETSQLDEQRLAPTFGDVAFRVGGKNAERFIVSSVILTQFGYCVGYFIFLSQTLHDVVGSAAPVPLFILAPFPILSAMALLVSIRTLGPFSAFANGALLCGFVAVVTFIIRHFNWTPTQVPLTSFPMFFGQMTAAIEGIGLVIPLEASMRNKKDFALILRIALVALTVILMAVGVLGFATFGKDTRSIILLNFGASPTVVAVKIVLMVGILFTYPLQIIPVFEFAERIILGPPVEEETSTQLEEFQIEDEDVEEDQYGKATEHVSESIFLRDRKRIAVRLGVVTLTAVTAVVAGTSFGVFNSLVGSMGASMLAYTAPALLHNMAFKEQLGTGTKVKNYLIALFGVLGAVSGTLSSVWEIIEIHRGNATQT